MAEHAGVAPETGPSTPRQAMAEHAGAPPETGPSTPRSAGRTGAPQARSATGPPGSGPGPDGEMPRVAVSAPPTAGGVGAADVRAMQAALDEARRAAGHGDVPVGAVVVVDGQVVAARHNEREATGDPTAHAELLALRDAAAVVGSWRLTGATLVATLEPCPMCAGAAVAARVSRVVFAAADPKAGACGSLYNLCADPRLNHEMPVDAGVLAAEATELLVGFFADRRSG